MKLPGIFLNFGLVTVFYVVVLLFLDNQSGNFDHSNLHAKIPVLLGMVSFSWLLRYARWNWLLSKSGARYPKGQGLLAYLAGFAFTATPGKMGELIRIRYFKPMGVSSHKIISAFVFERLCDLISVLLLSLFIATMFEFFWLAATFVAIAIFAVSLLIFNPIILRQMSVRFRKLKWRRLYDFIQLFAQGIQGIRLWLTPSLFLMAVLFGVIAWGLVALSFVWLLYSENIFIAPLVSLAVYPLAMLMGAASMLPGGVGSTEASIVAILFSLDVSVDQAAIFAITIRITTLWSAIVTGMLSVVYLERILIREKN